MKFSTIVATLATLAVSGVTTAYYDDVYSLNDIYARDTDLYARDYYDYDSLYARDYYDHDDIYARDFYDYSDLFARDDDYLDYLYAREAYELGPRGNSGSKQDKEDKKERKKKIKDGEPIPKSNLRSDVTKLSGKCGWQAGIGGPRYGSTFRCIITGGGVCTSCVEGKHREGQDCEC